MSGVGWSLAPVSHLAFPAVHGPFPGLYRSGNPLPEPLPRRVADARRPATFLAPMEPEQDPVREIGAGYSYVALGCTFAAGIVVFMAGGLLLDRWLHLTPLFTIVGTVVGAVLSFLSVYWKLQAETEARRSHKAGSGRSS